MGESLKILVERYGYGIKVCSTDTCVRPFKIIKEHDSESYVAFCDGREIIVRKECDTTNDYVLF